MVGFEQALAKGAMCDVHRAFGSRTLFSHTGDIPLRVESHPGPARRAARHRQTPETAKEQFSRVESRASTVCSDRARPRGKGLVKYSHCVQKGFKKYGMFHT